MSLESTQKVGNDMCILIALSLPVLLKILILFEYTAYHLKGGTSRTPLIYRSTIPRTL